MTPLVLLVGFLGAGKTTVLRRLLPDLISAGLRPSVILNDYQNARVDAEYFREMEAVVHPISGSCVCCGSRQDLLDALDAMELGPQSVVLVETNGTTDAEELVGFLAADPGLRHYTLPWQISVVDAKRWQKRFWHNGLEADQVKTASVVILGHLDEVGEERGAVVRSALERSGTAAPILGLEQVVKEVTELTAEVSPFEDRLAPAQSTCCSHSAEEHHHHIDHHHDHHDEENAHHREHDHLHHHEAARHHFAACEVALPALLAEADLRRALAGMPEEVLRAKGLAYLRASAGGEPEWFIFQKIGRFDEVQLAPLGGEPAVEVPLAVFIGGQLPEHWPADFLQLLTPATVSLAG